MKASWTELAVFGGAPAFEQTLHVGRPNLGDRDSFMERLDDLLDRRWLTSDGRFVKQFARGIARRIGIRHCIAVCNATTALQLAIRAAGVSGEVIVPSLRSFLPLTALPGSRSHPCFATSTQQPITLTRNRSND